MAISVYEQMSSLKALVMKDKEFMSALGILEQIVTDGDSNATKTTKFLKQNERFTFDAEFSEKATTYPLMVTLNSVAPLATSSTDFGIPQYEFTIIYQKGNSANAMKMADILKRLIHRKTIDGYDYECQGTSPQTAIKNNQEKISIRFSTEGDEI